MNRYEYKVVAYDTKGLFGGKIDSEDFESQLNRLGDEGWEMVSCTSSNQSYGSSKSIVCIFKRQKDQW